MPNFNFGMRKPEEILSGNILSPTDPANMTEKVKNIEADRLRAFNRHPFKLYEGQRFDDMVESVKANGIMSPIIVQPIKGEDGFYEILSGHNRTEAAKAAGLEYIPAIVREGLSDEEAMLIVTETNLIQRSFADLSHSERAVTLAMHHEAIKRQGKRTDLINEIENLLKNGLNPSNNAEFGTSDPMGRKLEARDKTGQNYDLSGTNVTRYLRVNQLIDDLKKRLDSGEFAFRAAVEISYLKTGEQEDLEILLDSGVYKLDMKKAEQLRELSGKKNLSESDIEEVLLGIARKKSSGTNKPPKVTLKPKTLARFYTASSKAEEIETEIVAALEFYHGNDMSEVFKALEFYRANKPKTKERREEYGGEEESLGDDES